MTLRDVEEATEQASIERLSQPDRKRQNQKAVAEYPARTCRALRDQLREADGNGRVISRRRQPATDNERHGRIATFAEHNLTPEEEFEMMEYLQFIRSRKRPRDQT